MASRSEVCGNGEDCDVMAFRPGPWESDRGALPFSMGPNWLGRDDSSRAHPWLAPLAWICVFLAGAAFWIAVFRFIF